MSESERKFVGEAHQEGFAVAWLGHVCLQDPRFPEGTVSSVYYDTPALDSFEEKNNGDFLKRKCRLRWYPTDTSARSQRSTVYLEVKERCGESRRKSRTKLEVESSWLENADLDDPGFGDLLGRHASPLGERLPAELEAVAVIRYYRRRFVCPFSLARVCLDTDIEVVRINRRAIPAGSDVHASVAVVEVKGEPQVEIPWLSALYQAGFRWRSFSKYGECMGLLMED